jgi:hypothetical protein
MVREMAAAGEGTVGHMHASAERTSHLQWRRAAGIMVVVAAVAVLMVGLAARSDLGRQHGLESSASSEDADATSSDGEPVERTMGLSPGGDNGVASTADVNPVAVRVASGIIILGLRVHFFILMRGFVRHIGARRRASVRT